MILRNVCPYCESEEWEENPDVDDSEDGCLYRCKFCGDGFDLPKEVEVGEDDE